MTKSTLSYHPKTNIFPPIPCPSCKNQIPFTKQYFGRFVDNETINDEYNYTCPHCKQELILAKYPNNNLIHVELFTLTQLEFIQ